MNAVIFDLDGVIVSTDELHYQAWKEIADKEGIFFSREINERLRGVSRMESLNIVLEHSKKQYGQQALYALAKEKNEIYKKSLERLSRQDVLPGVLPLLSELKKRQIKTAIGSSSKNAKIILKRIGLADAFDVVVDGNDIKKSKPDPEVFLLAAQRLKQEAKDCLVIEDADAGIEAALAAGMQAFGVGALAAAYKPYRTAIDLAHITLEELLK